MAIKTFTTGEVLTAADTNTYLANSGLVYVKSQAVGSGVSSVPVADAFSATYDNYRIVWTGGSMSVDTNLMMTVGSASASYYGALIYGSYSGGSASVAGDLNQSRWSWAGGSTMATIDIYNPFATTATDISSRARYSTVYGTYQGTLLTTASYTSFTFTPASGTMTGGTITVYGYRKA